MPRWFAALALFAVVFLGAPAPDAEARHAERSVRLLRSLSAWTPPDGLWSVGVEGQTAVIDLAADEQRLWTDLQSVSLTWELGLAGWLRVWGEAPRHAWNGAPEGLGFPTSGSGLGDLELGAVIAPWRPLDDLAVALDIRRTFATGDEAAGTGAGAADAYAGLALTWRAWAEGPAPEMRLHLNVGRLIHGGDEAYGGYGAGALQTWGRPYPASTADAGNDPLAAALALEFRKGPVSLYLEHARHFYDEALVMSREEPRWLSAGLTWGGETGPALLLSWDVPTSVDEPETAYRPLLPDQTIRAGLSWNFAVGGRDRDGDGLLDRLDPCPCDAEDFDGYLDEDGCPDPDNDGDGVPDAEDAAPDVPEDHDGFEDEDGLPEPDNDGDGFLDGDDACPNEAEDFDGHQDDDGCPEEFEDADGDGIPDEDDVCPLQPEDVDGYRDEDGCPDPDNDLDGIPDVDDACPDEPEDYDGDEDEDGCPD